MSEIGGGLRVISKSLHKANPLPFWECKSLAAKGRMNRRFGPVHDA